MFVRDFQPLPIRDRRLVLRELGVSDVDHRDDEAFYGWLAGIYQAGAAASVDAALRRCGGKAQERTSSQRGVAWLLKVTDHSRPPHRDPAAAIAKLVAAARLGSPETVQLLEALAPNFGWLPAARSAQPVEDLDPTSASAPLPAEEHADLTDMDPSGHDGSKQEPPASPSSTSPVMDAALISDRLSAALSRLAHEPDFDLLMRAADLADAIEGHLGVKEAAESRRRGVQRAVAALLRLADVRGDDEADDDRERLPDGVDPIEIAVAAEEAVEALEALSAARVIWADAAGGSKTDRESAMRLLDDAEERWEAADESLTALLNDGSRDSGPPSIVTEGGDASRVVEPQAISVQPEAPLAPDDVNDVTDVREAEPADVPVAPVAVCRAETAAGRDDNRVEILSGDDPEPSVSIEEQVLHDAILPIDEVIPISGLVSDEVREGGMDRGSAPAAEEADGWNAWIATAVLEGRTGLALRLSEARDLAGARGMPASLLAGVVHGGSILGAYDAAWHAYEGLSEDLVSAMEEPDDAGSSRGRALMLVAGALRPAVLQSSTAMELLEGLGGDLAASLNPLFRVVSDVRASGVTEMADIAAPSGEGDRRRRLLNATAAIAEWRATAPLRTTNFSPATLLWQALTSPDGEIGRCAALIVDGAPSAPDVARDLIVRLTDGLETFIDESDEARPTRGRRNPVEGTARKQLRYLFGTVAGLFAEWLRADAARDVGEDRHRQRRGSLLRELRAARAAVASSIEQADVVAATVFDTTVAELEAELQGAIRQATMSADDELALLPGFPLNGRRDVRVEPDDVPDLSAAAEHSLGEGRMPTVSEAFHETLAVGGISAARRLLPFLADEARAAGLTRLGAETRRHRELLAARIKLLRLRLDDLQIALTESDALPDAIEREMVAFEDGLVERLPLETGERGDVADFPTAHRRLDAMEVRLDRARRPVAERLEERVAVQEVRLDQRLDECRTLLAEGDLGTLAEYVSQVERHGSTVAAEEPGVELLRRMNALVEALGDRPAIDLPKLTRAARRGDAEGAFDFSGLSEDERPRAAALLDGWIALRRSSTQSAAGGLTGVRASFVDVMTALGFTGVRVEDARKEKAWIRLTVATDPLRDRAKCLAPSFGSEADGLYAVVVVPDGDERSAANLFDQLPDRVLVFATTALSPRLRRDIQRQARAGARSVAVFDMVTAVVLAQEPEADTRAFFDLSLPFGAAWPYVDSGSHTSIEMFFGRERELRDLVDRQGACLVYGGRQLGKTALLKQIELRENVGADRVAIYCDIRPVGESVRSEEIWQRIADRLRERRIVLPDGAALPERLRSWAQAAPGRYMLVLLDEADAFLEAEMSADFPVIGRMKALMEETGRAVKFVFAGLHNVQRFHRAPNSPLLHLGRSINVGPLLGGDREAARRMAFEPMAALGLTFEEPVDAYHMLSLVGFYPSLVQSFGKAIVQAVADRLKRNGDVDPPPVVIRRDLIRSCFDQQAFRAGVVERFQKTLQLDERYELITYAVWQQAQQDMREGRQGARGYAASEIRRMADFWWQAGFRDTDSPDSFTAILDEMVEMGVLAREGERYGLRSQRIAAMLGSEAEIDDRLQSFSERAPKRRADPMTSHRRIGPAWSPLSLRQEAVLADRLARADHAVRVVLIGATRASGLDRLEEAITTLAADLRWPAPRQLRSEPASVILDVVKSVRKEARPGAPKLVVVHGWPSAADLAKLRSDRMLRDPGLPVRIIHLGPPSPDLMAVEEGPDWLRVILGPLPIEAMVHWMNREGLPFADQEEIQVALRERTGGFLAALDGIKPVTSAERADPIRLLERASTATAGLAAEDLGLDDRSLAFVASLRDAVGDEVYPLHDLSEWALGHDPAAGPARLLHLRGMGLIEMVPNAEAEERVRLNPVVRVPR